MRNLSRKNDKIATERISKRENKLLRNNWNRFLDLIFLKHLGSISYIDTQTMKYQELQRKILKVAKNIDVYINVIHNYYVGFPSGVKDDQEDDPSTPMVKANTPCYDHETKGKKFIFWNQYGLKSIAKNISSIIETEYK